MDVLVQMNSGYLNSFWNFRKAKKWVENGIVQVMGSDSHNMTSRMPDLGRTFEQYRKDIDFSLIHENSAMIFQSALNT